MIKHNAYMRRSAYYLLVIRMGKILSKIRIPLDELPEDATKEIKSKNGKIIVVESKEPCLTCGRHKRIQFTQRFDGKLYLVEECLYCLARVKTKRNRETR